MLHQVLIRKSVHPDIKLWLFENYFTKSEADPNAFANKIEAIKYIRAQMDTGLKEAKDYIDTVNEEFCKWHDVQNRWTPAVMDLIRTAEKLLNRARNDPTHYATDLIRDVEAALKRAKGE